MGAGLKEAISTRLDLVSERFQSAQESVLSFLSFFEKPGHLYRVLEAMHETGFLRRFLPEFERVHCHIQYDRYHLYPVDVHSLYSVQELETLGNETETPSWPLLGQLMKEIRDPGLLKLAALVHDLGKAEGASHALRGEKIAASIGTRLGLSAERIDNPPVPGAGAFEFRRDRPATGPERRKPHLPVCPIGWRQRTLEDALPPGLCRPPRRGALGLDGLERYAAAGAVHQDPPSAGEGGGAWEGRRRSGSSASRGRSWNCSRGQISPPRISEYLVTIPSRHYQVCDARSLGRQILMAERLSDESVVLDGEEKPEEGCDEVTVVARDEPGLFAKICGVLTANFLNILSAEISTWENGIAVDQFRVQSLIEEGLLQPRRWIKLQEDLKRVLEGKVGVSALLQEMVPPLFHRYTPSRLPPKVDVDNSISDFYTVVEVYTHDRPGLLYRIAQKIFEMGLNLWMARISTKVDQVVDVFYIQDLSGAKVEDEEKIGMIKKELLEELAELKDHSPAVPPSLTDFEHPDYFSLTLLSVP